MNLTLMAYKLNDSDMVVTRKSLIVGAKDSDFTEVTLIIPIDDIKERAEEIEMLGLDNEDDF